LLDGAACDGLADGDYEEDGDVDLDDFEALPACLDGVDQLPLPATGRCHLNCLNASTSTRMKTWT